VKSQVISNTVAMKPTPVPKQLKTMKPVGVPRSMPMAKAPKSSTLVIPTF
jgi:hypothetical protein